MRFFKYVADPNETPNAQLAILWGGEGPSSPTEDSPDEFPRGVYRRGGVARGVFSQRPRPAVRKTANNSAAEPRRGIPRAASSQPAAGPAGR